MKRIIVLLSAIFLLFMFTGCRVLDGSVVSYSWADRYQTGDAILNTPVHDVKIHWISGNVEIRSSTENSVSISETGNRYLSDDLIVHYWLDGTTLYIEPCASGAVYPDTLEKELTVFLPKDCLQSLQVNSVSSNAALKKLTAETVVFHSVSGECNLESCDFSHQLEVRTTSGGLYGSLVGKLENLEFNSVSGSVSLEAETVDHAAFETTSGSVMLTIEESPQTLDHRSVSGGITVTLPETTSFMLEFKTVSGSFYCDIPHTTRGETYIVGSGGKRYTVHTTSGNVIIRKK